MTSYILSQGDHTIETPELFLMGARKMQAARFIGQNRRLVGAFGTALALESSTVPAALHYFGRSSSFILLLSKHDRQNQKSLQIPMVPTVIASVMPVVAHQCLNYVAYLASFAGYQPFQLWQTVDANSPEVGIVVTGLGLENCFQCSLFNKIFRFLYDMEVEVGYESMPIFQQNALTVRGNSNETLFYERLQPLFTGG